MNGMKFYLTIAILSLQITMLKAQWSVIDTDQYPRPSWYKYQPFTKADWKGSNFASPEKMKWFTDARYGMFIHFGLSAYVDKDVSWPICYTRKAPDTGHGAYPDSVWHKWPSKFKLENFNADEWVQIARDAGMKYIVVIGKHHDGFHMWDTRFSDFKITNTPFGRDYLKEIADACHKVNMPFGIYYSQRDWYHPDYSPVDPSVVKASAEPPYFEVLPGKKLAPGPSHKKYIDYQFSVVRELCTKYGKIDLFWFDAAWWGGMFTSDMWDAENLTRMIRKLQPDIVINNRASVPGDFDTPEQQVGTYQSRPWESCMTLNGEWAHSSSPNRSEKSLIRDLLSSAQGNGNVLLSWGPRWDGKFDTVQKKLLLNIGGWLKKYGNGIYGTKGGPWLPEKWGGATYKGNKIYIYVYDWKDGKLKLPAIPGNAILNLKYLNVKGEATFEVKKEEWQFSKPESPDDIATIIELEMAKPVAGVLNRQKHSFFDSPEYGAAIKTAKIISSDWKNGKYLIDLKKNHQLTGIGIYGSNGPIVISVSLNGKDWKEAGVINSERKEMAMTTYLSGAEVLGKNVRYLQLNRQGKPGPVTFTIYSKE